MRLETLNSRFNIFTLQLLGWGVILGTTIFWSVSSSSLDKFDQIAFIRLSIHILTLLLIYLLNYLYFIPKFLFERRRGAFFLANLLLIIALLFLSNYINDSKVIASFFNLEDAMRPPRRKANSNMMFIYRDSINYILMVGLVTALRLADRLQKSEEALREAERARVEAELANLRSQINPHFLLNTLNNIYALTAIDTDKAQKTIKELSDLLRYILYDNMLDRVALIKEVDFLKSYIELMSIRLPRKVVLTTEFKVSEGSTTQIAPLIFISLVENAFKHSVSAAGEGFIDICFEESEERGEVTLSITNSNCAKQDEDKSGHGIGLEQVQRRLELLYPKNHTWDVIQNDEIYKSLLTIRI